MLSLLACSPEATPESPDIEATVQAKVKETLASMPTPEHPTPTPMPRFGPGLYYRQPFLDSPGALLMNLDNIPLARINVQAFDISSETVVYAVDDKLALVAPDGNVNMINVPGLHQMDRPSFSPDGTKVTVQARETYTEPEDLNIYVVDLNTGKAERISHLDVNEESPEWFANENKIAYTSFDPTRELIVHIYDMDIGKEIQVIKEAGYIHLAVSADGTLVFNPILARLYAVNTGKVVVDLKDKVLTALENNGYTLDTRFRGQANLGTFPMDADFSPDGNHIVFDGAVEKNGKFGLVIFSMTTTGDNITPLTEIIEVNPAFSNNNNYSQLNPNWR